jgi:hypothetical protein
MFEITGKQLAAEQRRRVRAQIKAENPLVRIAEVAGFIMLALGAAALGGVFFFWLAGY